MTDDVVAAIDRRYAIAAVRAEAERAGLDAERLLDSQKFVNQITAMNIESADFPRRVRELVRSAAPAELDKPDAQSPAPTGQAQWTREDLARNRHNTRAVREALAAGLLQDLGLAPSRRRRR